MNIEQLAREAGFSFDPTFESCGPNPMWIADTTDITRFAVLVRAQALEDAARHFDGRDAGAGGFYEPHEPAQIIRALQK